MPSRPCDSIPLMQELDSSILCAIVEREIPDSYKPGEIPYSYEPGEIPYSYKPECFVNGKYLKPGESVILEVYNCTKVIGTCVHRDHQCLLTKTNVTKTCDEPKPDQNCIPIGYDANGCCKIYDCNREIPYSYKPECFVNGKYLKPGESVILEVYNCTKVIGTCVHRDHQCQLTKTNVTKTCDEPKPDQNCIPIGYDANGCCKIYDCNREIPYSYKPECFVNGKYLKPGESVILEVYNCTKVIGTCVHRDHQCLLTKTNVTKTCDEPKPDQNCIPIGYDANGCCKIYDCNREIPYSYKPECFVNGKYLKPGESVILEVYNCTKVIGTCVHRDHQCLLTKTNVTKTCDEPKPDQNCIPIGYDANGCCKIYDCNREIPYSYKPECFVNGKYLKPGESVILEVYNCTKVIGTCVHRDHQCQLTKTNVTKTCDEPKPDQNCIPIGYDANGCCKIYDCNREIPYSYKPECFVNGKYLKPGESVILEVYNCTKVIGTCVHRDHQCLLTKTNVTKTCDEPKPDQNCIPIGYDANGCCKIYDCNTVCTIIADTVALRKDDCEVEVILNRCKGRCNSESMYNRVTDKIETHCGCCVPKKFTKMTAQANCKDGQMMLMEYILFQECECNYNVCKYYH
ncbi:intestinal mucin-like protein [Heptranchias perlo]|uniref:intestinal mucin-like protein n=1 Tax=Heptranchias perlo TaxID=212740 RepID=UPI0035596822